MKKVTFLLIFLIVVIAGCNAKHCVKYENENYGNFEYCYDITASEIEGTPVFTNADANASLITVEESLLDKIKNKLTSWLLPSTLNYKSTTNKSKVKEIKKLLEELERRKSNANK